MGRGNLRFGMVNAGSGLSPPWQDIPNQNGGEHTTPFFFLQALFYSSGADNNRNGQTVPPAARCATLKAGCGCALPLVPRAKSHPPLSWKCVGRIVSIQPCLCGSLLEMSSTNFSVAAFLLFPSRLALRARRALPRHISDIAEPMLPVDNKKQRWMIRFLVSMPIKPDSASSEKSRDGARRTEVGGIIPPLSLTIQLIFVSGGPAEGQSLALFYQWV